MSDEQKNEIKISINKGIVAHAVIAMVVAGLVGWLKLTVSQTLSQIHSDFKTELLDAQAAQDAHNDAKFVTRELYFANMSQLNQSINSLKDGQDRSAKMLTEIINKSKEK